MKSIKLNEKSRTYSFGEAGQVRLENVIELTVSESGNHRLKTADGNLHIVPADWIHILIEDESHNWTV